MYYRSSDIDWVKEILEDIGVNKTYLLEHIGEDPVEDKLRIEMIRIDLEKVKQILSN